MRVLLFLLSLHLSNRLSVVDGGDTECTRRCTMDDKKPDCWRQSLTFFTEQLHTAVQQYVGTLTHISRWNSLNEKAPHYHAMANAAVASVISSVEQVKQLEPLSAEAILAIIETILNKTSAVEEHYNALETIPVSFSCPIPCDYYPSVWMTLFFITLAALFLLCISFCLYLAHQQLNVLERSKTR